MKQSNYLDNGSRVIWDYCLIVLNPQANPSSVSNQQKAKKINWAQDLAIDVFNSVFNSNIDNRQSIGSAVLMEFTLMIVACRRAQKQILVEIDSATVVADSATVGATSTTVLVAPYTVDDGSNSLCSAALLDASEWTKVTRKSRTGRLGRPPSM